MDLPLFGDAPNKRRREINLGGNHSATSYNDIVSEAKLRRLQRNDLKRRQDAVVHIQRFWRGHAAKQSVRQSLRATFEQDVASITALRCLVLLGKDEESLGHWSVVVTSSRKGAFMASVSCSFPHALADVLAQSDQSSVVLLQRTSRLLLQSLSRDLRYVFLLAYYCPPHKVP